MPQIAKVAVSAANYAIDKPYDYLLPDGTDAAVGSRVLVPFGRGNRLTEGMILSLERKTPEKALKAVREVLEPEPVCSEREIRLALWMRQRYFCTFYDAIRTILPAGVWYRYRQFWKLADYAGEDALSEKEKPLYALLSRGEQELETLAQAVPDAAALLRQMEKKGLVTSRTQGSRRVGDRVVPSFSKGQKRIAGYILANYDKAAFMTARRLGVIAHVSESTVVRFAVHLGYDGYPSMQKALQELIRGKLTSIQRIQVSHDQMSGGDVLGSVMQRDMNSIHTAIENIDRAEFDRVVGLLLGAEHIYLLGVRSSAFLAGYLNFYMQLLFKNLTLVQSSVSGSIFEQLVQIGPGDVLLGISFPRYSKTAVNAVQYARERGAEVVAITDSRMSPLYQAAQASLLVRSDMISFVDSMAAPLSLLNALILALGRRKSEEVSGTFAELERVWSKYSVFGKADDE